MDTSKDANQMLYSIDVSISTQHDMKHFQTLFWRYIWYITHSEKQLAQYFTNGRKQLLAHSFVIQSLHLSNDTHPSQVCHGVCFFYNSSLHTMRESKYPTCLQHIRQSFQHINLMLILDELLIAHQPFHHSLIYLCIFQVETDDLSFEASAA